MHNIYLKIYNKCTNISASHCICFIVFIHLSTIKKKKKEKITIDFDEQIGEVSDQISENSIIIEPSGENVICSL